MKNITKLVLTTILISTSVFSQTEPVKMNKSGIFHNTESTYNQQTKNFAPYKTLDECLKSGRRFPKK